MSGVGVDSAEYVRSRGAVVNPGVGGNSDINLPVDVLTDNSSKFTDAVNLIPLLFSDKRSRSPLLCAIFNVFLIIFLTYLTESTHSMAFRCLIFISLFDLFSLVTCLITIWVSRQPQSPAYSFGYARCEVLSVFSSTMLAMLGCVIVSKEAVEHFIVDHGEALDVNWLLTGTAISLSFHLFVAYGIHNPAMTHAIETAPSSWLQEHVADVSRAICAVVPGLDKMLLPRINSVVLIGVSCGAMLCSTCVLVSISQYQVIDSIAAVLIAVMMFGTMLPLSIYSGKILVQTTPTHVVGQLDKTLREISTLDGVLEFRNEHFWTIGFNTLCGSVQIRVRRDANEQLVLAHVLSRLSASAPNVTVQIFKDDWTQLSATTKFYYNRSAASTESQGHGHSHDSHGGHGHSHGDGGGHGHSHGDGGGHGGHGGHGSHEGHGHSHDSPHSHDHGGSHSNHEQSDCSDHSNRVPSQFHNSNLYLNPRRESPNSNGVLSDPMRVI